jgi:hypothetical protein
VSELSIVKTTHAALPFVIVRDASGVCEVLARVKTIELARLFIAGEELLAACKRLVEADEINDSQLLREAIKEACVFMARAEGE